MTDYQRRMLEKNNAVGVFTFQTRDGLWEAKVVDPFKRDAILADVEGCATEDAAIWSAVAKARCKGRRWIALA